MCAWRRMASFACARKSLTSAGLMSGTGGLQFGFELGEHRLVFDALALELGDAAIFLIEQSADLLLRFVERGVCLGSGRYFRCASRSSCVVAPASSTVRLSVQNDPPSMHESANLAPALLGPCSFFS